MADAPPPNLRPIRPIKRVPFVEEVLPLLGPALADPNDQTHAAAPAASAAPAATPSFVTSPTSTPSLVSKVASAAPGVAAFASAPSAASALGAITPALGRVSPALSKIASAAPTVEALIEKPSLATALGAAAPTLSSAAPNIAQYANPLLQTIASHDLNAPYGAMLDRNEGIGQPHPKEDAEVREFLKDTAKEKVPELAVSEGILKPLLERAGIEGAAARIGLGGALETLAVGAAGLVGGVVAGVFMNSKPLNVGEDEAVRQMHEKDPAWQEMLRRYKEDPTYSPFHDDPPPES